MEDLSNYNPEGSPLRRMQKRMLEMLEIFDSLCKKHDIPYWISDGTLLGAYRHGGFIPWDDDIDIQMLQKDCKRLFQILSSELPSNLKVQSSETDSNYWYTFFKIRDLDSIINEPNTEKFNYKYRGIFIDILPVEPTISLLLKKGADILRSRFKTRKHKPKEKLINILAYCLYPLYFCFLGVNRLYIRCFNPEAYTYNLGTPFYHIYHKKDIFPLKRITFEGKEFNSPKNVENILTCTFGADYMKIPPADKRITHIDNVVFMDK